MSFSGRRVACFFLFILSIAGLALGQSFQGGVRGAVHDPGGAVVPGVDITLTNVATNAERTTVTNETGQYSFTFVSPGTYKIRAALPGFRTFEQSGFSIGTQQFTALDITLQ